MGTYEEQMNQCAAAGRAAAGARGRLHRRPVRADARVCADTGPWPTITAHHFDTVEELVATSSGPMPRRRARVLTLDDVATAHFRGFFGKNSVSFYPELDDCFYNSGFLELVTATTGARSTRSRRMMLFNLCGPHHSGLQRAPRRGHVPGRPHRELAGVAAERDGEVGPVHATTW